MDEYLLVHTTHHESASSLNVRSELKWEGVNFLILTEGEKNPKPINPSTPKYL